MIDGALAEETSDGFEFIATRTFPGEWTAAGFAAVGGDTSERKAAA